MAKRKEELHEYDLNDAREALDNLEAKLEDLTVKVERRLAQERGALHKAPGKSNVAAVPMPTDIKVDVKDKYNTQPHDSVLHHYGKNYRMFRKDALHNVFKSKMFWVLLVILPMIMTFIEFVMTGWGMVNNFILSSGLEKVSVDLINWFMLMPLLLLSLIIFPTFIAMSRENNQLKRYAMKGMSRKQIYWAYIRFSIAFLFVMVFLWMGVWVAILNKATESIYGTMPDGSAIFKNPWGIFFGMDFQALKNKESINAENLAWIWNTKDLGLTDMQVIVGIINGSIDTSTWISGQDVYNFITTSDTATIEATFASIPGLAFTFRDSEEALAILTDPGTVYDPTTGMITFSRRITILLPSYHDGINATAFFGLFILVTFGVNSVGFNKAMKVSSSRGLMGWGIGLWIFASVVQGTSSLLYNDIYKFDGIDGIWNYVVMILLFILKWMFLLSPVTIMMAGISLTTGLISEPPVVEGLSSSMESILSAIDSAGLSGPIVDVIVGKLEWIQANEYDPLIAPHTTTQIFIALSAIWALGWTIKIWETKKQVVSYEAAR